MIHRFGRHDTACCPYAGLAMDAAGNLYGTGGAAFELSPPTGPGKWTETVLHRFTGRNGDGAGPFAGVILDTAGNLYGTTEEGGKGCAPPGCGIVYELQPMPDGSWKEQILHDFPAFTGDGEFPGVGALTMDGAGNIYGTTDIGGARGYGTVFELTPEGNGGWREAILHSFDGGRNGFGASSGVVFGPSGELYGTTIGGGGACECGLVYKLSPTQGGQWKYRVLHRFTGYDGAQPDANLIIDRSGNLYGTTATGGAGGAGVVFEITP